MRTHYLIVSILCFILTGLLMFCMGCYTSWPVVCRHHAELCRIVAEEQGFETRKILGKNAEGIWHIQTQALINEKWEWLNTNGREVFVDYKDYWFEP